MEDASIKEIFDYIQTCIDDGAFYNDAKIDINLICTKIYNEGYDAGIDHATQHAVEADNKKPCGAIRCIARYGSEICVGGCKLFTD